jgi:hypothetical protein
LLYWKWNYFSIRSLVDHGGDNGLLVHRGLVAMAGGVLTGVSMHGRCGKRKLAVMGGNARGGYEETY